MVRRPTRSSGSDGDAEALGMSSIDRMLLEANERGDESFETGRFLVTYAQEATDDSKSALESLGLRTADARDFADQAVNISDVGDADALVLPEIGVALVSAPDFAERSVGLAEDSSNPVESVDPEYFMFADGITPDYMRGFRRAVEAIAKDAGVAPGYPDQEEEEFEAEVLGATWGLHACKVPPSSKSGAGIRVAILDTGMALNHPDFAGRQFLTNTFVGQPVQDLNGHGTHCTGTACGPLAPPGTTPRYGIGYKVAPIVIGKVLTNSGSGSMASVLAGMNWAIANNCTVISMSLGAQIGPQPAYTAAGQAALNKKLLIIAAAGNAGGQTGAPANSPTIMSVAALQQNLVPAPFSNFGKIEIAAPGVNIFSSWPLPQRYKSLNGTSMAAPHVAGCAALWAQSSAALRGQALWNKLQATAKPLPFPVSKVGKGLVQSPP